MTLITLMTFAIALAIAAAIPGPGMTALVARALAVGFVDTIPMVMGVIAGDIAFLTLTVLGLATLATQFAAVFAVIKFFGIIYLLHVAWQLWHSDPAVQEIAAAAAPRQTWARSFIGGLSLTLANPKTMVFYLALLPSIIDLNRLTPAVFAAMVLIIFVTLTIVGFAYTGAAAGARDFFRNRTARKRLDRTAGAMMAGAAVAMAVR